MKICPHVLNPTDFCRWGGYRKWPKEPASNGAPCTKALFENKAKGVIEQRLAHPGPKRKAIHLEASVRDASYLRSQAELRLHMARH
jgi:hypothetical protein